MSDVKPGTTTAEDVVEKMVEEITNLSEENNRLKVILLRIKNALVLKTNYNQLSEHISNLIRSEL